MRGPAAALLSCLLLIGLTALSVGNAEAGKPHKRRHALPDRLIEEHAGRLGLDHETLAAIRSIVDAAHQRHETLRDELRQARDRMHALLAQETPDEAAVMRQAEAVGALRLARWKNRLRALLRIRALLTPDQRQELMRIHAELRAHRRGDAPPACQDDAAQLCADVASGRARLRCLHDHPADLSEACQEALERHEGHQKPAQ